MVLPQPIYACVCARVCTYVCRCIHIRIKKIKNKKYLLERGWSYRSQAARMHAPSLVRSLLHGLSEFSTEFSLLSLLHSLSEFSLLHGLSEFSLLHGLSEFSTEFSLLCLLHGFLRSLVYFLYYRVFRSSVYYMVLRS